MSNLYGDQHRELQDHFQSRKLADRVEESIVSDSLSAQGIAFIESRDMFFLSTVDHRGRPTVSHKGGDIGFVRVLDDRTIAFPNYNGNGMFLSMGNINANANVGLLLMDFENPFRMRIQGTASAHTEDVLLAEYPEADMIIRVAVSQTWINCPRYIHKYQKLATSRYVPKAACETPYAEWKRIDYLQDVLPPKDAGKTALSGGTLTMEEWAAKVARGEG